MKKIFKRSIAIFLCLTMVFNYSFSVLANENVESSEPETTYTETIDTTESSETTESIEEEIGEEAEEEVVEEEAIDNSSEEIIEPEDDNEDIEDVYENEPEEDIEEEPEEEGNEDIEEVDVASPSEIVDEEGEEEDSIPADMVDEPEEEEVVDEPEEESMLLGSVASSSDTEEVEEETEIDEEVEEASPSELEVDMPMLLGAPLFGDPLPTDVCKIGSTGYATLGDALSAVTSGQTITMLDDISYTDGTDFIIDGKNVTIDFDGHKITVSIAGMTTINKLFTVTNSGNLTVDSGEIVLSGMYNTVAPFTVTGAGSKLTLIDMTQASNLDRLLTLDGGTATINGGTFGTNNTATKINLTNNATLKLTNEPAFFCQGNVINISATSNTDADTLMGNVIIDSGDFNCVGTETTGIMALYGKANVTINNATFTSSNANSAPIFIGNAGYKSSLTINNLTSDSPYVFESNNNSNIESFTATVNNGHFKYTKGKFAIDRSNNSLKPNIRLKGGFYGPDVPDTDAFNELNDLCISGSEIQTLTSSDPEYANGYRYKIYSNTPSPTPTPPSGGGGSSGGSGGGGAGLPKYDTLGNIIGPSGKQSYTYDGTNPPNLIGNINVSSWNYATGTSQSNNIQYVQNTDSFVRADNTPVVTEWVGVTTNDIGKVMWYRTDATGKILKNQFIQIGTNIYYLDNNGIMVTGQYTINGKVYNFETAVGATEGRFLY